MELTTAVFGNGGKTLPLTPPPGHTAALTRCALLSPNIDNHIRSFAQGRAQMLLLVCLLPGMALSLLRVNPSRGG